MQELDLPEIIAIAIVFLILAGSIALWFAQLLMPRRLIQQKTPIPSWEIGWSNFGIFLCALIVTLYFAQILGSFFLSGKVSFGENGNYELTPWLAVLAVVLVQVPFLAVFYSSRRFFPKQFGGPINSNHFGFIKALFRAAPLFLRFLPIIWLFTLTWTGTLTILQKFELIGELPDQKLIEIIAAGGDPLAIAILVFLGIIGAPVIEELIYRGCLYRFLKTKMLTPFAQFFSGIVFALTHGNLMSFGPILIVGIFLAYVYETEGNLKVSICFHALFNSFSIVMLLIINQSSSYTHTLTP